MRLFHVISAMDTFARARGMALNMSCSTYTAIGNWLPAAQPHLPCFPGQRGRTIRPPLPSQPSPGQMMGTSAAQLHCFPCSQNPPNPSMSHGLCCEAGRGLIAPSPPGLPIVSGARS
jgi:hypothetical protein